MHDQAFTTGHAFLVDVDETHEYLAQVFAEEMGTHPFPGVIETIVSDLLLYTFCGDQVEGERVLERRLLRLHFGELQSIKIARRAYELLYQTMGIQGQRQLLGSFDYHYDKERRLVLVRGTLTPKRQYRQDIDATLAELEQLIANGDYVPERLRRLVHEHRIS